MRAAPRPTTDQAQAKRDLDVHGYCIVENALPEQLVADLRARILEQADGERERAIHVTNEPHPDKINQWITFVLNKGEVFREVPALPHINDLVAHVLGQAYLLSVYEAYVVRKGGSAMPLHVDQWWMPYAVPRAGGGMPVGDITRQAAYGTGGPAGTDHIWPASLVNVMFMVSPFTADNGGTLLVPGSHQRGDQPNGKLPHQLETISAEGPAGSAVIWDGRTWHAAGINTTDEARIGLTAAYIGPMFRQLTNFGIGLHSDVYDACSERMLELMGFKLWATYGATDDPARAFVERREGRMGLLAPNNQTAA